MNNDKYKEAFKACPFCGSSRVDMVTGVMHEGWKFWRAYCINCQMRTEPIKSKQEAIDRWNTRQSDQPQMAELEQAKVAVNPSRLSVQYATSLYRAGWDDAGKGRDYAPQACQEWTDVVSMLQAKASPVSELECGQGEPIDSEGGHHD